MRKPAWLITRERPSLAEEVLELMREQRKDMPWMPPVMTAEEIAEFKRENSDKGCDSLERLYSLD